MSNDNTIFTVKGDEKFLKNQHNTAFHSYESSVDDDGDDGESQFSGSFSGDRGTPVPVHHASFVLRITTNHQPRNAHRGFVIGRNPDVCDILLDDPGISEKHIAVTLNMEFGTILLKNLFRHGTLVKFYKQEQTRTLRGQQSLLALEEADIMFADSLKIQIKLANRPTDWLQYCTTLRKLVNAPGLSGLALSTNIQTTSASHRAPVYIQDRRLGKGSFGQVFTAVEKYTGVVYAMKVYDQHKNAGWNEPELLQRLSHENIVRYVAYIHLPNQPVKLIMEYAAGPNLKDYMDPRNGHSWLDKVEARSILNQLLEAAAHLHSKGITHRDIKPANIILTQRDPTHVKMVDFGMATDLSVFEKYRSTPAYSAPEVLDRKKCTNKVDMFSIGVIALQLFYGSSYSLDGAHDPIACLSAYLKQGQAQNEAFPVQFDLVTSLLSENPDDRPSAEECLEHAYFQSDTPVETPSGSFGFVPDLNNQTANPGREHSESESEPLGTEIADTAERAQYMEQVVDVPESDVQRRGQIRQARHETSTSSVSSAPHKRLKQEHAIASGSQRSTFVRSAAPSPYVRSESHSNQASMAAAENPASESSGIPDTASFVSQRDSGASGNSHGGSPQQVR